VQRAKSPFLFPVSDPGINQNKQKGKAVLSDGLSRELRILRDALLFLILVDFPSRGIGKIKGEFRALRSATQGSALRTRSLSRKAGESFHIGCGA